jgi:hypothetical protein
MAALTVGPTAPESGRIKVVNRSKAAEKLPKVAAENGFDHVITAVCE